MPINRINKMTSHVDGDCCTIATIGANFLSVAAISLPYCPSQHHIVLVTYSLVMSPILVVIENLSQQVNAKPKSL